MSDLNVDAERRICYENYLRIESTVGSTTKNSFLRGICSKHLTRKKFVSCGDRGEVVRLYFYNGGLKCFFSLIYKNFEEKSDTYTPRCAIVE